MDVITLVYKRSNKKFGRILSLYHTNFKYFYRQSAILYKIDVSENITNIANKFDSEEVAHWIEEPNVILIDIIPFSAKSKI